MTSRTNSYILSLLLVVAVAGAPVLVAAQDWSNYDWSQEEVVLGDPSETTAQATEAAQKAVAASSMQVTMNAVGFDIPEGSTAEQYLQKVAQVGGGSYFRAEAGGELAKAMDLAAKGQVSAPPPQPTATVGEMVVCRRLDAGQPQDVADHFPSAGEVWVHATFTDMPDNTVAQCVWYRNGKQFSKSERTIRGNGWVAFAVNTSDPKGFGAGTYSVHLSAGGKVLGQRQFTIGAP